VAAAAAGLLSGAEAGGAQAFACMTGGSSFRCSRRSKNAEGAALEDGGQGWAPSSEHVAAGGRSSVVARGRRRFRCHGNAVAEGAVAVHEVDEDMGVPAEEEMAAAPMDLGFPSQPAHVVSAVFPAGALELPPQSAGLMSNRRQLQGEQYQEESGGVAGVGSGTSAAAGGGRGGVFLPARGRARGARVTAVVGGYNTRSVRGKQQGAGEQACQEQHGKERGAKRSHKD
jgi:hypothetical protein